MNVLTNTLGADMKATHHITWFVKSGEERSYLVSEEEAFFTMSVALRMGYYVTVTPISAYEGKP